MTPKTQRHPIIRRWVKVAIAPGSAYLMLCLFVGFAQRSMLYFPTHEVAESALLPWSLNGETVGYCRPVNEPKTIWLMLHGNGGQAADRSYVLPKISPSDSLYVLEYPGYGSRGGSPSKESINAAALTAYRALQRVFPSTPIGVIGESIGSGPASSLASVPLPPAKIILVVPFDTLANVAARRFPFLPVRMLLLDRWDNVAALRAYTGPIEIYGALDDHIIPYEHAKNLATQLPAATWTAIEGGHNTWSSSNRVRIER